MRHRLSICRPPLARALLAVLALPLLLVVSISAYSQPAWWSDYGLLDPEAPADDFAAANLGQAKHAASKARLYLDDTLPGGAGTAITTMVDAWIAPISLTDDFATLNLGQLKAIAAPFHDRLIAVGYSTTYPWTATTIDDDDFTLANLGQLKLVFSFDLTLDEDQPPNGLPDWWEHYYFGQTNNDPEADPDGDGLTNLQEWQLHIDPTAMDSDMDGMPDGWEASQSLLPRARSDGAADADGDGWSNLAEFLAGSNPNEANSELPGISTEQFMFDDGDRLTEISSPAPVTAELDAELNITNIQ